MGHGGNTTQMKIVHGIPSFVPPKLSHRQVLSPGHLLQLRAWRGEGLRHKLLLLNMKGLLSGILEACFESWRVLSSMRIELYSTSISTFKAKSHNGRIYLQFQLT